MIIVHALCALHQVVLPMIITKLTSSPLQLYDSPDGGKLLSMNVLLLTGWCSTGTEGVVECFHCELAHEEKHTDTTSETLVSTYTKEIISAVSALSVGLKYH